MIFFSYFEEDITTPIQDTTLPPTTTPPHSPSFSSQDGGSSEKSQKMRSLSDIYDKTEEIIANDLFYLFVDSEPLNYDDAVKDENGGKQWRKKSMQLRRMTLENCQLFPRVMKLLVSNGSLRKRRM